MYRIHRVISNHLSSSVFPICFRLIISLASLVAGCHCQGLSNARLLALIYVIGSKFYKQILYTHSHIQNVYITIYIFFIVLRIRQTLCCLFAVSVDAMSSCEMPREQKALRGKGMPDARLAVRTK